ncbi:TPA: SDR family oxidoreductase, partial [Escherichia coli]|nr:SDR family oxidoreductase [Escherichia coli]
KILLRRLGEQQDVANLVEFLLSQKSSYITAQSFIIDGGMSS